MPEGTATRRPGLGQHHQAVAPGQQQHPDERGRAELPAVPASAPGPRRMRSTTASTRRRRRTAAAEMSGGRDSTATRMPR